MIDFNYNLQRAFERTYRVIDSPPSPNCSFEDVDPKIKFRMEHVLLENCITSTFDSKLSLNRTCSTFEAEPFINLDDITEHSMNSILSLSQSSNIANKEEYYKTLAHTHFDNDKSDRSSKDSGILAPSNSFVSQSSPATLIQESQSYEQDFYSNSNSNSRCNVVLKLLKSSWKIIENNLRSCKNVKNEYH